MKTRARKEWGWGGGREEKKDKRKKRRRGGVVDGQAGKQAE